MVVVEVRQGTLGVDGRGWGPAENTVDRGSQLDEDDEDDEDDKDDKDDKEDEEEEERRTRQEEEEEEEATDIKSNNPHLAGGEKHNLQGFSTFSIRPLSKKHRKINGKIGIPTTPSRLPSKPAAGNLQKSNLHNFQVGGVVRRLPSGKGLGQVLTRKPRQHPFFTIFEPNELYVCIYIYIYIYMCVFIYLCNI